MTASTAASRPGDGIRTRILKDFAFTVAGTDEEARARESAVAQVTIADARAAGSWRTVVAPPGEHRPLHAVGNEIIEGLLVRCRDEIRASRAADRTQHLQVVQNWGAQAGARTNHLCFDLYDLPQIPHRIGEELGGAARFLIREGECPFCRLVREEVRRPDRLLYADDNAVAFAPWAGRSPFEIWVVPRRHDADFARATRRATSSPRRRRCATSWASWRPAWTGRRTTWSSTPRRSRNRSTRPTIGTGRSTPGCARLRAWSWAPGLPVNPVSPEDAVDELRSGPDAGAPPEHPRR